MYRRLLTADRPRRGSVAVEYACLITIIIAILIPSVGSIGWLVHREFSALDTSPPAAEAEVSSPDDPTSIPAPSSPTSRAPEPGSVLVAEFSLAFAVLAIIAVAVLAFRRHRYQSRGEEEELDLGGTALPVHLSADLFEKRQKIQTAISTHWCKGVDGGLLVSEIMTRGPKCVSPEMSYDEASTLMLDRELHHLLVTDADGRLVGVMSSHDFDRREGDNVGALMTPDPHRVRSTDTISAAITVLLTNRVHCLPVENNDGQLVGVLTGSDLAMGLQCALRALEEVSIVLTGRERRGVSLASAHSN